ncbi:hypothetical protein [Nitrosomonas communis]|uniref:Uncharacterized protein n=1 Tax=Nitrosomonas communis TaxID=44574 RepID=A0A1I4STR7_9PROT|nr:hypothetical protein [Nitrosomonas communis]SFM67740.1 hypothetical protein SAMN05421863_104327 [Nitrosomonas communis]
MYQIARQKCSRQVYKKGFDFLAYRFCIFWDGDSHKCIGRIKKAMQLEKSAAGPQPPRFRGGWGANWLFAHSGALGGAVAGRGWLPHPVHFRRARDLFSMSAFRSCRRLGFDLASILTNRSHRSCISDSSEEFLWC